MENCDDPAHPHAARRRLDPAEDPPSREPSDDHRARIQRRRGAQPPARSRSHDRGRRDPRCRVRDRHHHLAGSGVRPALQLSLQRDVLRRGPVVVRAAAPRAAGRAVRTGPPRVVTVEPAHPRRLGANSGRHGGPDGLRAVRDQCRARARRHQPGERGRQLLRRPDGRDRPRPGDRRPRARATAGARRRRSLAAADHGRLRVRGDVPGCVRSAGGRPDRDRRVDAHVRRPRSSLVRADPGRSR
jgi:hypothetical protein